MKINYAYIDDKKNNFLENFFNKKKFVLKDLNTLKLISGPKLIIIDFNLEENLLKQSILNLEGFNSSTTIFLPKKLSHLTISSLYKKVFYPINVNELENIIKKDIFDEINYQGVLIKQNNLVINQINNLQVYFTTTETSIIKLLIEEKKISKTKIKSDILHYNQSLNTRSLESHLSRIRKKLKSIKSKICIISENNQYIKIN